MKYKLGEICTFYSGTGFPTKYQGNETGEFPFYKVGDIANNVQSGKRRLEFCNNYISKQDVKEIKGTLIPPNTVVFAKIGEAVKLNRRALTTTMCLVDNNVMGLCPNSEKVLVEYFFYLLKNIRMELLADTTTVPSVRKSKLEALLVEIPRVEDQNRIVEKINSVSSIIAKRKQQIYELDNLIKSRFVEMFGDPKLNDKGWKTGVVSDYFEVKGGKRIPKGMGYSDKVTNHPYLRATDMKNETILDDDIHYIEDDVFQHIKRYTVAGGDIYLTNVGVNLGMAGVIPEKYDGANLTENAVKLVPKNETVLEGKFLAYYINSPGIQGYINERKMSVGVPKLAIFRIETMPLLIPPRELQNEFICLVAQVDKLKFEVQKSLDEAQTLMDSLMQQYFG